MVWEGVVTAQEEMIPAELRQWRRRRESRTTGEVHEMRCSEQPYVGEVRQTAPGLSDQKHGGVIHCGRQCQRRSRLGWALRACWAHRPVGALTSGQLDIESHQGGLGGSQRAGVVRERAQLWG